MPSNEQQNLFKNGSVTYFTSSLFFPPEVREYVTRLYAFVRKADDFVDANPQYITEFHNFKEQYEIALDKKLAEKSNWQSGNFVIDDYINLAIEKNFDHKWMAAFLDAMEADLTKSSYATIEETEKYMYGSAEVIGLFMCRILGIPDKAFSAARSLGKAMQYINFIRDINEDISLGRQYLPVSEMKKFGLSELSEKEARANPKAFAEFIRAQISHYSTWQQEAEYGYKYIPRRYKIAIKTAADMYKWTAKQIQQNPMVVFEKKVKPRKRRIVLTAVKNLLNF